MAATSATATACGKINLTLDVLGRRSDGYHELISFVAGVDLRDRIRCSVREEPGLALTCDDPTLRGPDNLACRAALKLAHQVECHTGLGIHIEKAIPVGGGMGGGSSDAATTLRLCNDNWGAGLSSDRLAAIGAEVGSDVPLFFSLPTAVMRGRGERVERVAMRWSGWVLLAFVDASVSTADVYRAWRAEDTTVLPAAGSGAISRILGAPTAAELSRLLSNHLEQAVFRVCPAVEGVCEQLNRAGVGPMRVSGAGSTLYRLFDDKESACRAVKKIEDLRIGVKTAVVAAPVEPDSVLSEES